MKRTNFARRFDKPDLNFQKFILVAKAQVIFRNHNPRQNLFSADDEITRPWTIIFHAAARRMTSYLVFTSRSNWPNFYSVAAVVRQPACLLCIDGPSAHLYDVVPRKEVPFGGRETKI